MTLPYSSIVVKKIGLFTTFFLTVLVAVLVGERFVSSQSAPVLKLHFNGESTEHVASPANGSAVTPTFGPAGTFVKLGTGAVNHDFVTSINTTNKGVYFTPGGQQNANKAYYKISGAPVGTLFDINAGEMTFTLKSRLTFLARQTNSRVRVFDVYDAIAFKKNDF